MSAATKSNKGGNNNSFETYRQIAPETVDDQRLRNIIKNNNNDHNAIVAAIENIWHDTPDEKAVGSEWVTTSKVKKQEAPAVKPSKDSGRRESGGRGGAGRGRSLPPAGGRGNGDNRGAPRSASVKAPVGGRDSPAVRASPTVQESENVEEVTEAVSEPIAVAPAPVPTASIPAASGVAWGRGASLAQKLKDAEKQKDAEKAKAETQAKEEAPAAVVESDVQKRGRNRRPRGASAGAAPAAEKRGAEETVAEVTEATATLAVVEEKKVEQENSVPSPPPLVQVSAAPVETVQIPEVVVAPTTSAPQQQQGFLNMGKWEAPVEAAEIGAAFQFGSFGSSNVYGEDDSANSGVSASQVGTNPSAAPWTGLHSAEDSSSSNSKTSNVWGASSEQSLDISSGLFSAQQTAVSSSANKVDSSAMDASGLSTSSNVAATRAPPGLAQNKNNNANNSNTTRPVGQQQTKKADVASQPVQQQQTQLPVYQQQQYNQQQAGIPPGMNSRSLGLNPSLGALPYPYTADPFNMLAHQAAAQYGAYPLGTAQVPPLAGVPATSSAATTATSTAASAASTPASGAPNALAQQQAQQFAAQQAAAAAAAAAYPYYPNPYYAGQYGYYGQQMPGFYNQGRDMYQQPQQRPYTNNPYGNAGALYPGDVYGQQQAGQFPESAGASTAGSSNNKTTKSTNAGNTAGAVAAAQGVNPDQHTANLLMNSGYGYVNPYNQPRQDAWQQQQGAYPGAQQAGGWPMMYGAGPGAASTPAALGGVGGFAPQGQGNAVATQQGQSNTNSNRGNNNNNNNAYANNSFGGRGASGVAPAASAGGVTQNW